MNEGALIDDMARTMVDLASSEADSAVPPIANDTAPSRNDGYAIDEQMESVLRTRLSIKTYEKSALRVLDLVKNQIRALESDIRDSPARIEVVDIHDRVIKLRKALRAAASGAAKSAIVITVQSDLNQELDAITNDLGPLPSSADMPQARTYNTGMLPIHP